MLELAYAGGRDGMEVTNRVLGDLEHILSDNGVAYVLLCASNRPLEVAKRLEERGWRAECVGDSGKKGGCERLSVWRIWR